MIEMHEVELNKIYSMICVACGRHQMVSWKSCNFLANDETFLHLAKNNMVSNFIITCGDLANDCPLILRDHVSMLSNQCVGFACPTGVFGPASVLVVLNALQVSHVLCLSTVAQTHVQTYRPMLSSKSFLKDAVSKICWDIFEIAFNELFCWNLVEREI